MRNSYLSILLILITGIFVFPQKKDKSPIGVYESCVLFVCEAIKLNSDQTFNYLIDGDLFNNERNRGTWKFLTDDLIKFDNPKPPSIEKAVEKIENNDEILTIVVKENLDEARVPNAEIIYFTNNQRVKSFTNEKGIAKIPKVKNFTVSAVACLQEYTIQNSESTKIELTIRLYDIYTFNETLKFVKDKLCNVDENQQISRCYEKLKAKEAEKLFPNFKE
jgi:adenylate kinase family enzyme